MLYLYVCCKGLVFSTQIMFLSKMACVGFGQGVC